MSVFAAGGVIEALAGRGLPSSPALDMAGELLGGIPGFWINHGLSLDLQNVEQAEGQLSRDRIIEVIRQWAHNNPNEVPDPALMAGRAFDPALGMTQDRHKMIIGEGK